MIYYTQNGKIFEKGVKININSWVYKFLDIIYFQDNLLICIDRYENIRNVIRIIILIALSKTRKKGVEEICENLHDEAVFQS